MTFIIQIGRNVFLNHHITVNSLHLWKSQWTKIQSDRRSYKQESSRQFSKGFWSQECILFHSDPLRSNFISFGSALWFQCTFVSRNNNFYLEHCFWAIEACFVPMRRTRYLLHKTQWSLKLFASTIQERISLGCLLSGTFSFSMIFLDRNKGDDDKTYFST